MPKAPTIINGFHFVFPAKPFRGLKALVALARRFVADHRNIAGFTAEPNGDETLLGRHFPGRGIRRLPARVVFRPAKKGRRAHAEVIRRMTVLASPVFILNDPTCTTVARATISLDRFGNSWSFDLFSLANGSWHGDHLALYWQRVGVGRRHKHLKFDRAVSPREGWKLVKLPAGSVISDGEGRRYLVTRQARGRTYAARIRGNIDCTYRATNVVSATFRSGGTPRGALEFLGFVPDGMLQQCIAAIDTKARVGSGSYHSG